MDRKPDANRPPMDSRPTYLKDAVATRVPQSHFLRDTQRKLLALLHTMRMDRLLLMERLLLLEILYWNRINFQHGVSSVLGTVYFFHDVLCCILSIDRILFRC